MRTVGVALLLATLTSGALLVAPGAADASSSTSSSTFGTLPSPCGKGHATGATDQGVTNSTINIAYGDDRGFSGLPGLDQEMGDAVKDMIAWCNAQGGINGRKLVGDYYDAAVTNVGSVMSQACKQDFMLVGEGFALDGVAEQTRLGCNLASVPGFTVSSVVANAYEMYQASPNPANASPVSSAYQAEKLFGSKTKHAGVYGSTLSTQQSSTTKAVQAYTEAGWKFVPNCTADIDYNGEANYTPFMQKLQSCGAQVIFNDATPGPTLYGAFEAENQIGYDPIWVMDSGAYTAAFAQWNTDGLANNAYVRISYEPLEAAKVVPAVAQYLSIVKKYGGLTSQLGEQATSSFLLWATQAKACGSTLTRQCMINHLSKVTSWTGGGLNASGNPAKNIPPNCGLLMKLDNTKWVQAYPKKLGTFDCSSKYVAPNSGSVVGTTLNAQGYATQYATSSVIKPQG
ncbi:MAG: ABC transporter substrate-binding protein [Acidimicrobiales bacterium]|jgi:ABC-type branched-subunit amino acid transport system substrate-binding protein